MLGITYKIYFILFCLYELIEWAVADVFFPEQDFAYLGTQGGIWDAQKDMFMAFFGALISMIGIYLLKRMRNK
jgi:putative membrane protein